MVEKKELNYFDDLLKAAKGGSADVAIRAAMGAAWNEATLASLLDLLEEKGVVTKQDREEVKANAKKTLEQMKKDIAERYPEESARAAEEYDKQHP